MALVLKQQRQFKKIERVEARLNPEQKRRIEYAASLKGTSISDFIVSSADDAAVRTIEQHEVWTLTGRDRSLRQGAAAPASSEPSYQGCRPALQNPSTRFVNRQQDTAE